MARKSKRVSEGGQVDKFESDLQGTTRGQLTGVRLFTGGGEKIKAVDSSDEIGLSCQFGRPCGRGILELIWLHGNTAQ